MKAGILKCLIVDALLCLPLSISGPLSKVIALVWREFPNA